MERIINRHQHIVYMVGYVQEVLDDSLRRGVYRGDDNPLAGMRFEHYDKVRKSGARLTQSQRRVLEELRSLLLMKEANFGLHPFDADKLPKNVKESDSFVKEQTRLCRESWLFPIVDALLGDDDGTTSEMLHAEV